MYDRGTGVGLFPLARLVLPALSPNSVKRGKEANRPHGRFARAIGIVFRYQGRKTRQYARRQGAVSLTAGEQLTQDQSLVGG